MPMTAQGWASFLDRQPGSAAQRLSTLECEAERLRVALRELVAAVEAEVNEKGGGGFILARLTDARAALAKTAQR